MNISTVARNRAAFIFIAITSCWLAFTATSCISQDEGFVNIADGRHDISLSGTSPVTIEFEASSDWYARTYYDETSSSNNTEEQRWLNVTPLSGTANDTYITIMATSPNYTGIDKTARVEIKLPGGAGAIINVTHPAVAKPRNLASITRSMAGGTIAGPTLLSFQYTEGSDGEAIVTSFSSGTGSSATTYSATTGSSSGEIIMRTGTTESSLPISMLNERIYEYSDAVWSFSDVNSGIVLNTSTVSFSFNYDSSEDKLLKQITRNETITMDDGELLNPERLVTETYNYTYDDFLRIDSLCHITTYNQNTAEPVSDTVSYKLFYPNDGTLQSNTLTTNIVDMLLFPELQGSPFYTTTGFSTLGLTGTMQTSFPASAKVETKIHSEEGLAIMWPETYLYIYQMSETELSSMSVRMTYPDAATSNVLTTFSYEED